MCHALNDRSFFAADGVVHFKFEHKAVQLCFGQRISSLLFNGVLRCHDQERLRQQKTFSADGDLFFLHGFKQCALHLGGSAVDLIRQNDIGKNRSGLC